MKIRLGLFPANTYLEFPVLGSLREGGVACLQVVLNITLYINKPEWIQITPSRPPIITLIPGYRVGLGTQNPVQHV